MKLTLPRMEMRQGRGNVALMGLAEQYLLVSLQPASVSQELLQGCF